MFDRFKRANNLGEPDSLDMNNRTKWTAQTIRYLFRTLACVEFF